MWGKDDHRSTRRQLLGRTCTTAGALALGAFALAGQADAWEDGGGAMPSAPPPRGRARPNILVIMVDEMRSPRWFPPAATLDAMLPNVASIRRGAVSFERHYTASNNCSPARGALLTGLYSHQTGCLVTGRSELDPGFPTWGTLLRELGYQTTWWGKWHVSHVGTLEPWGFSGGTFPPPDGAPGQGLSADPHIASQFESWLAQAGGDEPWCTTVSFVNPHDIVWWWNYTRHIAGEQSAPRVFSRLPGNFETPAQLASARKPRLQLALQEVTAAGFGTVPYTGPTAAARWCEQLDLYLKLQRDVDLQIGRVLTALARRPAIRDNTVIVFTSDHGEYSGSHGLRGKGAAAYEEGIAVPLFVKDPRGELTRAPNTPRTQLTSSVDVAPLLLTIATDSNEWRTEPRYAHLATRADLAAICADPSSPGRPWIVHATDEIETEFCPQPYAASAPRHVVAVRTAQAKYATYSNWQPGTLAVAAGSHEAELYDYTTTAGSRELANIAGRSALEEPLQRLLSEQVIPYELAAPLPQRLRPAQAAGHANYLHVSSVVDAQVARYAERRLAHQELHNLTAPGWPDPFVRPRGGRPPRPRSVRRH
jgi:arylsulfatase A-like enzyme